MSKIFVVGREPVATSRSEALRIKEMWEASKVEKGKDYLLPKVVDVGNASFEGKDIRGFEITNDSLVFEQSEYDLNDPAQKAKVKAFEKEFLEWINLEGGKYIPGEKFNYFLQDKGAIKITGKYCEYAVSDEKKFKELNKLFSSLNTLRRLRDKAEGYNNPDHEAQNIKRLAEIKKGIVAGFPKPNPALAEVMADAKEFNRQHDMEEIDPATIPF